jgi:hypothetical protein
MQCRGNSDCKRICEANLATGYSPPQVELQSGGEMRYGLAANLGRGMRQTVSLTVHDALD